MTSECGTPDGQVCGEGKPSGQKCLYQHLGSDLISTNGTHTTPICRYVDDITFFFQAENTGCWILVKSPANSYLNIKHKPVLRYYS